MPNVVLEISVSLDGYVAGPRPTLENPLGEGGERLHDWVVRLATWREAHGLEGGEAGPEDDLVRETLRRQGAVVMGRRMFSGGEGQWESDPNAGGWWGDEPPFGVPVFVLTHHAREPLELGATTFTFVTDGVDGAVERARSAAGERDVLVAGGAEAARQVLDAGLLDEVHLHVAPVLLGGGTRLFDGIAVTAVELEPLPAVDSPFAAHLTYKLGER